MAQRTCFEFSLKITFPQSVNEAYMTSQIIMVSMFVHKTKVHRQYLRHSSSQEPLSPGLWSSTQTDAFLLLLSSCPVWWVPTVRPWLGSDDTAGEIQAASIGTGTRHPASAAADSNLSAAQPQGVFLSFAYPRHRLVSRQLQQGVFLSSVYPRPMSRQSQSKTRAKAVHDYSWRLASCSCS